MKLKKILPYLIPSIADIFFAILLVVMSLNLGQHLLADCDTGYHIRTGEYILETLSIPQVDIFSFLEPSPAWTAHEWLSAIIMALSHQMLGLTGVVIFFAFIIALTYYILFKFLRSYSDHILLITCLALLVTASSTIHFLARPHLFSLLFMVICYYIVDNYQYRNKNNLYFLPLLMIIWVNLHGAFIIGFVLLGTFVTGNVIYYFLKQGQEKQVYAQKSKAFIVVSLFCLLASLINPYSYQILLFPFDFVTNKFLIAHVHEFHPTSFQDLLVFKYLFMVMLAVLMTSRLRLNVMELLLVLGFTYMSLYSMRNIPLFAIIVAPIIIRRLDDMVRNSNNRIILFLNARSQSIAETDKTARGFLWPAIAVSLIVLLAVSGGIKHSFDHEIKPIAAVEFLKEEPISGNMFNNDEFGDYLIYAAYPQYRVFFDGRNDMYGVEHMKDYLRVIRLGKGWENVLETYNIQWIFFDANSLLSRHLLEREDWRLIYADKVAHIYVRDIPEYEYLIEKYPDVESVFYEDQ